MAHELVFNADGTARMGYRNRGEQSVPWHRYGEGIESDVTIADMHRIIGTDSEVFARSLFLENGAPVELGAVTVWEDRQLGIVGPKYVPLQNKDFVDSFNPWLESKLGEIETFGLLRGGAVIWGSVKLAGVDDAEIRKDDPIRTYGTFVHSHDGSMGLFAGFSFTRPVCMNTIKMSLSEMSGEKSTKRAKHVGNVKAKIDDLQDFIIKAHAAQAKMVESLQFLTTVPVRSPEQVYRFVRAVQNKSVELEPGYKPGSVEKDIEARFRSGIGNLGLDYFDLLNAWTEKITHDLGNVMSGETDADRVARRLDNQWFGAGALSNVRAFNVALQQAKAA